MDNENSTKEVFIEYLFNADIERVFKAWTDPEQLVQWYAPDGCTIRFKSIEVKPGGKFHSCISNPQSGDCWATGEYLEIIPNEKIAFTLMNADENGTPINPADIGMDPEWPAKTLVTVTFVEENLKTKMHLHQTVSTAIAQKTGAYPSWIQMLENMNSLLNQKLL